MAKKKKHTRKGKHIPSIQSVTIPNQIRKARNYPIHECYYNSKWKEMGMSTVIITRKKPDGLLIVGFYLLDVWCLGVKNAFSNTDFSEQQLREAIDRNVNETLILTSSDFAHSLIYGSVFYAEELGFEPHKDFEIAKFILDEIETIEYDKTIKFGKDGKPYYFSGQFDSPEKERKIIETLRKNVGEGNFDFVIKHEAAL